jgi:hypothetical protein
MTSLSLKNEITKYQTKKRQKKKRKTDPSLISFPTSEEEVPGDTFNLCPLYVNVVISVHRLLHGCYLFAGIERSP